MNRISDYLELKLNIVEWLTTYFDESGMGCFVVGVSGGIDSAVVSTLAAETGRQVYVLNMPIHQKAEQVELSAAHIEWLEDKYPNVTGMKFNLTGVFETFKDTIGKINETNHSLANTRSRLRMVTLYQIAGRYGGLVVGTGNKVEDYGVGFYTKYGDGGVDLAPIADLYKTEVWELGKFLGVDERIVQAPPTDGLWDDKRTDEDQLGATYEQLEEAMETGTGPGVEVLERFNKMNQHKMQPIPTFTL
jgi:NAD+ synthase|tara:strand:+ start:762 stop:1502 length:741 start_codon:yes stop_codon:yes gene_type:complete